MPSSFCGVRSRSRIGPLLGRIDKDHSTPAPSHPTVTVGVELLALASVAFLAGVAGFFLGIGGGITVVVLANLFLGLTPGLA